MDEINWKNFYGMIIVALQYAVMIAIFVFYRKKVRKKINKYFKNNKGKENEKNPGEVSEESLKLTGFNLVNYFLQQAIQKANVSQDVKNKLSNLPIAKNFLNLSQSRPISVLNEVSDDKIKKETTINSLLFTGSSKLERHKKYIQVALNSDLFEAQRIISQLPQSDRIIIEAGTPLIKTFGASAVSSLKSFSMSPNTYVVADTKTADMGEKEVQMMASVGASAATALGVAPIETINSFISACKKYNIDSMVDMMNVENPLLVLKKLKQQPRVVIVHRGVDETQENKSKVLPYYQINQIKGYNNEILVAIAGGDSPLEIQSAVFNGADIVVLWKSFYKAEGDVGQLVQEFLKTIR